MYNWGYFTLWFLLKSIAQFGETIECVFYAVHVRSISNNWPNLERINSQINIEIVPSSEQHDKWAELILFFRNIRRCQLGTWVKIIYYIDRLILVACASLAGCVWAEAEHARKWVDPMWDGEWEWEWRRTANRAPHTPIMGPEQSNASQAYLSKTEWVLPLRSIRYRSGEQGGLWRLSPPHCEQNLKQEVIKASVDSGICSIHKVASERGRRCKIIRLEINNEEFCRFSAAKLFADSFQFVRKT